MRDPQRIRRIIFKLIKSWRNQPDLRLGQLIKNLTFEEKCPLFYLEDEDLEKLIDERIEKIEQQ